MEAHKVEDIRQNIAEKMAKQMKCEKYANDQRRASRTIEDVKKYAENGGQEDICRIIKNLNLSKQQITLKELIERLYEIFENDRVNVEEVHALMSAYQSNPAEWLKFAKFDRYKYTRNLVDAGNGKFNLMILCWGEGQGSSIHDHADAHCFMKMLTGSLCETRYEWPEKKDDEDANPMREISRSILRTNEVCYINDSIGLHRVENLSYSDCAVSLHLYSPPFNSCTVFDARTGRSSKVTATFWSVYGERKKDGNSNESS
ncbi:hypothetical protein V9T40_005765 [Parthenolecanium corni]|uniref:Cysteine dioxygenase n=1 Tax=Parthenolecanium corni TaxID=536013 RepID=A0AAN9YAT0_9HEMI